jgi:hypothetical protein
MAKLGNARSGQAGLMRGLRQTVADPDRPEKARDAAARRLVTHGAMKEAGAFVNKPVTMDTAVESQLGLIHRGIARGRADAPMTGVKEGSGSNVAGLGHLGADWYFQHNAKLGAVAAQTGIGKPEVIAGSAVMSPQNNPVQELAAVGSLARAHADPAARVKVTPQAVAHSEDKSIADWSGRSVHPTEMMSSQFAALKAPEVRPHVGVKGDVDLATMAKGAPPRTSPRPWTCCGATRRPPRPSTRTPRPRSTATTPASPTATPPTFIPTRSSWGAWTTRCARSPASSAWTPSG